MSLLASKGKEFILIQFYLMNG